MSTAYFLYVTLGFFASFISAVFGVGTALVMVALGAQLLPVKESIALAGVLFIALSISKTYLFRQHIDWKMVLLLSASSIPFAYLGGLLLQHVPELLLKRVLGVSILGYLGWVQFKGPLKLKIGPAGLIFGGGAYGFVSGLLGSGSLIKAILVRETGLSKEAFVGVMAASAVLTNLAKLSAYLQSGLLHQGLATVSACLIVAAVIATLIGQRLLAFIPTHYFDFSIKLILALSSVGLLI